MIEIVVVVVVYFIATIGVYTLDTIRKHNDSTSCSYKASSTMTHDMTVSALPAGISNSTKSVQASVHRTKMDTLVREYSRSLTCQQLCDVLEKSEVIQLDSEDRAKLIKGNIDGSLFLGLTRDDLEKYGIACSTVNTLVAAIDYLKENFIEFSSCMSTNDLCEWLIQKGLDSEDCEIFRESKYEGWNFTKLAGQRIEKLKLSAAGRGLVEDLIENMINRSKRPKEGSYEKTTETEIDLFMNLGLGYGVNATSQSPLKFRSPFLARAVSDNPQNFQERPNFERKSFLRKLTSDSSYHGEVSASVSNAVNNFISLGVEGEVSKSTKTGKIVKGELKVTREVTFLEYKDDEVSRFEDLLCRYILREIPDANSKQPGKSTSEQVQIYLDKEETDQDQLDEVNKVCCTFINERGITHYITKINLGAARYSFHKSRQLSKKVVASLNVKSQGAGGGVGGGASSIHMESEGNVHSIGDLDNVKRGEGEVVVEFQIEPLFNLIRKRRHKLKDAVQIAIKILLNSAEGPYKITCGKKNEIYWKVDDSTPRNAVVGADSRDEASLFYLSKAPDCPNEYHIKYYGAKEEDRYSKDVRVQYLRTNINKITGKEEGPIGLSESKPTHFSLRCILTPKEEHSLAVMEEKPLYLQVEACKIHRNSYLAMKDKKTCCVNSKDDEGTMFQLNRERSSGDNDVFSVARQGLSGNTHT